MWHSLNLLLGIQSSALINGAYPHPSLASSLVPQPGWECWLDGRWRLLLVSKLSFSWLCAFPCGAAFAACPHGSTPIAPWEGRRNARIKSSISYLFEIHLLLASAAASTRVKLVSSSCALLSSPLLWVWKPQENVNPSRLCLLGTIWDCGTPSQEGPSPSLVRVV